VDKFGKRKDNLTLIATRELKQMDFVGIAKRLLFLRFVLNLH
jgi:hypothetical protein